MTEIYTDPVALGYGGSFELRVADNDNTRQLIVSRADDRVAVSNELWSELLDADAENAGYLGYPVIDSDELTMTLGIPGKGVGEVTYRFVDQVPDWILLEKVQ